MYISESKQLEQHLPNIDKHWQQCQKGYFQSPSGKLFYAYYVPSQPRYTVILVNGRIESAHKYRELFWEFAKNQIAVFSYDHPGQGYSPRPLKNHQIGHIQCFSDYGDTLHNFIANIVSPNSNVPQVILAHSMGGAIACDYLTRYQTNTIHGLYLSAPMLGINTAPYPAGVAKFIAGCACLLGLGKHYAIGQQPYINKPFANNELTGCSIRYALFRGLYDSYPELQLGGVSFSWLYEALSACQRLAKAKLAIPIRLASAKHDTIVDNLAQQRFIQHHPDASCMLFDGKHELLCEADPIRSAVISDFYAFCSSLTANETGS
ncbi:alpha/beta fold hydrolase [Pseudoalteromonas sp. T1lg65]|uniref:alpha/beta fold hydrolase n=1 Tax=Pseudoalteromonas sp. T1lg65 TaxID=2077101 RepID=UPI003F79F32E